MGAGQDRTTPFAAARVDKMAMRFLPRLLWTLDVSWSGLYVCVASLGCVTVCRVHAVVDDVSVKSPELD